MVNYNNGKIYKIVCNITGQIYIGSTCEPRLCLRLSKHVTDYKRWKLGKCNKITSYDILDRGNYNIYLIESFPCNSKDELTAREGGIIKQYRIDFECINYCTPGQTKKEYELENKEMIQKRKQVYREANRQKYKDYAKIQYESNKEQIKKEHAEKITCICGSVCRIDGKARHERRMKHQKYIILLQSEFR